MKLGVLYPDWHGVGVWQSRVLGGEAALDASWWSKVRTLEKKFWHLSNAAKRGMDMGEMCTGVRIYWFLMQPSVLLLGFRTNLTSFCVDFEEMLRFGVAANSFPHSFCCCDLNVCGVPFGTQKIPFTPPAASVWLQELFLTLHKVKFWKCGINFRGFF